MSDEDELQESSSSSASSFTSAISEAEVDEDPPLVQVQQIDKPNLLEVPKSREISIRSRISELTTNISRRFSNYTVIDELTPELKKLLECPVCHATSVPPIYLCGQGHIICHLCFAEFDKCSKCGSGFTSMRNELAECIVSKFHFKCPFDGCAKRPLLGHEVSDHLEKCEVRPIFCPIQVTRKKRHQHSCNIQVAFPEYIDHLKDKHGVIGFDGSSTVVNMSTTVKLGHGNWSFPPQYLTAFERTFLCHIHASFNLFIGWISLIGPSDEMQNFAGSVTIFNPHKKLQWQHVKWMGTVHSFRSTPQQVYDSGNCLILLPETFLLFTQIDIERTSEEHDNNNNKQDRSRVRKIREWNCHFEVIKVDELPIEDVEVEVETRIDEGVLIVDVNSNSNVALINDTDTAAPEEFIPDPDLIIHEDTNISTSATVIQAIGEAEAEIVVVTASSEIEN